ncbi:fibronectin type III domain-containing protein, partial [Planctomycetota bacterium]
NDADPNSPWKRPIWSFSIPPKTAYNPDPADGDGIAETTVNLSWTAGFGAKLHTIYIGDDFDTVANATVGIPAGTNSHNPGPLEAGKVYYWRVDEFDGLGTYKGDVWAFTTPGAVGSPQPANGADDITMAAVLSWSAADNAASHGVYLGLDKDAVRSADTTSPEYKGPKALGAESFDAGLLEANTTYYWRIDEVYNANTVKGPVWSFTVGAYLLVEDFESYTDDDAAGGAIWQTWIDGFGVADNGAQVGYLMPPYAEQTIIHGGSQSMPLMYVNEAGVTNSEASRTLAVLRDWTTAGVGELSLWYRGSAANAADPLYVVISNAAGAPAIAANDDSGAAAVGIWAEWCIPLQAFADQGINLTNVDKIAIGLGSKGGTAAGGSGTLFIDDIRLYR